jgi:glucokinase
MSKLAIAVDIGGSHVEFGIVCEDRVLISKTIKVQKASIKTVLPELQVELRSLISRSGVEERKIAGVVLGICAIADGTRSVLAANGKYADAVGFDFAGWSESSFGLPCRVENDTRLALLGEHYAGAARGYDDAALVTLGTGIGGAVMLGGRLLQSVGHRAGGLAGHLGVKWDGRTCSCGNRGCAEAEASTSVLDAICREMKGFAESILETSERPIDFQSLFDAVDAGDAFAQEVLNRCIEVWSALAVTLIHAYDPQIIVFGGGVLQRHEAILPRIREHVCRYAWVERDSVKIVPAQLGSSAALLGALPLLRRRG